MLNTLKFLLALAVAILLMLCFRALAFTVYVVEGTGLQPVYNPGDHVLVNRWSYGLRVGGDGGLFSYGRLGRQPVRRGDLVAFENPENTSEVLICRCRALPGDTVEHEGLTLTVPSLSNCDDGDYYWLEAIGPDNVIDSRCLGFIPEELIIGKATDIVYRIPLWD